MKRTPLWHSIIWTVIGLALALLWAWLESRAACAPAPLARHSRPADAHPDWLVGRWVVLWNGSPWLTDLGADGSYKATCGRVRHHFEGTWRYQGGRLSVRERRGDDDVWRTFTVPTDGSTAEVQDPKQYDFPNGITVGLRKPLTSEGD